MSERLCISNRLFFILFGCSSSSSRRLTVRNYGGKSFYSAHLLVAYGSARDSNFSMISWSWGIMYGSWYR